MQFYDTILYDKIHDIFDEFPEDIKDNIENILFKLKDKNNTLDDIWNLTKDICKEYTNIKLITYFDINIEKLLEDMKFHSIFNIYLSLEDQYIDKKISIKDCVNAYYENIDNSKGFEEVLTFFKNKFALWDWDNKDNNDNNDFLRCFYDNIFGCKEDFNYDNSSISDYNNYFNKISTLIYPEIFYIVITNWDTCPYNYKNLKNMDFTRLYRFYKKIDIAIKRASNGLDKTIKAYTIERIFKFSYIYNLANYIGTLYTEKIKKVLPRDREDGFIVLAEPENGEELYYPLDGICELPHTYRHNWSFVLKILSNMASNPMVFSRNEYIKVIDKILQHKIEEDYIDIRINLFFQYINYYIIPLMTNIFAYLILYFSKYHKLHEKTFVKKYIIKNINKKYNYNKFIINNKNIKFGDDTMKKNFNSNVYKTIYECNYIYDITKEFLESKDILQKLQNLSNEQVKERIREEIIYRHRMDLGKMGE